MANLQILYVQKKAAEPWIIWKRPIDTDGELINLVLLKFPMCVEYKITCV